MLIMLIAIVACNQKPNVKNLDSKTIPFAELQKASWLIGTWENNATAGNSTERWEKKNDSIFTGICFMIIGSDTVSYETICLEQKGTALFYIPTVKNQNEGESVRFELTSSTTEQLVFENPTHDFPRKITYTQITNDSLLAVVSGPRNGKEHSIQFPMKRIK
jgi:hypothetical protein